MGCSCLWRNAPHVTRVSNVTWWETLIWPLFQWPICVSILFHNGKIGNQLYFPQHVLGEIWSIKQWMSVISSRGQKCIHMNDTVGGVRLHTLFTELGYVDGLVQDCSISIALAMGILESCTKPSMWSTKCIHCLLNFITYSGIYLPI